MDKKVWGKTELVDKVAEKAGITKKDAKTAIEATMEVIKDSVKDGAEIRLRGFGTSTVRPERDAILRLELR